MQPYEDIKLTVSIDTGVFCNNTHRFIIAIKVEVSQFEVDIDRGPAVGLGVVPWERSFC